MQKLVFNTTTKTTKLYDNHSELSDFSFDNISTVSIRDGFYEIMKKTETASKPVARLPISNTNMIIEN